jgi:hypothetical protein
MEHSILTWQVDSISDTGPILRLESSELSKADRYANPSERKIYSSSINPIDFERIIATYLKSALHKIKAKKNWTWSEMRTLKY